MTGLICERLYIAFAITSCVASLGMLAIAAGIDSLGALLFLTLLGGWIIAPHLLGSLIGLRFVKEGQIVSAITYLILLTASLLSGFWIYIEYHFAGPPDAHSAFIFFFLPIFQWTFVMIARLPAKLVARIRR